MKTLQDIIDGGRRIAFFGRAGVSTESGIPDFRSADGLYNQEYRYPPETILSEQFFVIDTLVVILYFIRYRWFFIKHLTRVNLTITELEGSIFI